MPTISIFGGIEISMFFREHHPSHFHAERGDEEAEVGIDPIMILEGNLSRATRAKVFEWAAIHQADLRANWELARAGLPLLPWIERTGYDYSRNASTSCWTVLA